MNELMNGDKLENLLVSYKVCSDKKKKRLIHLRIVERTMKLVKKIATPIAVQSGLQTEDLIQVGALGLVKAIDFYEPDKNASFETYANYFIKGEIRHYVRDNAGLIKTPRKVQEQLFKLNAARKALAAEGVDEPSIEMLGKYISVTPEKINELLVLESLKSLVSLDQSEEDDTALLDKIPSMDSLNFWDSYEERIMLSDAVKKLPQQLREVIEMNFYDDMNQREISERLNISQMQVSRRIKKALNCLYKIIERN